MMSSRARRRWARERSGESSWRNGNVESAEQCDGMHTVMFIDGY